ncbi:MAG: TolC family protein, partial [Calditrichaeota bacterium]|nr:TolC family protein [Calditrichota bacterium]
DVTDAQVQLTRAQSDYVQAEHDAKVAKARLEAAMGIIK